MRCIKCKSETRYLHGLDPLCFKCICKRESNSVLEDILNDVLPLFGINKQKVKIKCREPEYVFTRYIYCYIARGAFPKKSFRDIGDLVGLEHATVMHGIKVINNMKETDMEFREYYGRFMDEEIIKYKS